MIPNKKFILNLVKEKGWNQSKLAAELGVSRQTVSRWINDKRGAGTCLISGIIKAFPEERIEDLFIY